MAIAPSRNWRTPECSTGRPVQPAHHHPAGDQRHRRDPQAGGQAGQAEQVGQQRHQRAEREREQGRDARQDGGGQLAGIHAEFFPRVHAQRRARVLGYRGGHPGRGLGVRAVLAEVAGQLFLFGDGEQGEHLLLQRDLGVHQLVLVGDRDVLAGSHRERPGYQRGYPGQHDRVRGHPAPAEPGDQGGVGDQPIHRTEYRRPQPAAGYVPVPVRPARAQRRRPGRRGWLACILVSHLPRSPPSPPVPERIAVTLG